MTVENNFTAPRDYFKIQFRILRYLGFGAYHDPSENNFQNYSSKLEMFFSAIHTVLWVIGSTASHMYAIPEIIKSEDFTSLMLCSTFGFFQIFAIPKAIALTINNKSIQTIAHTIEVKMWKYNQHLPVLKKCLKYSNILTFSFMISSYLLVPVLLIFKINKVLSMKAHGIPPSEWPLFSPIRTPLPINNSFSFSVVFIYASLGIMIYGGVMLVSDTLAASFLIHLSGQFEILGYTLLNLNSITLREIKTLITKDSQNSMLFLNMYNERLLYNLKRCVKHHIEIIKCIKEFENCYTFVFLGQYFSSLFVICLVLVQLTLSDVRSQGFLLACIFFNISIIQLGIQCLAADYMTNKGILVSNCAYSCNWYSNDKEFKQILSILITVAQKPQYVTAANMAVMSNEAFANILQGTYKYFSVLVNFIQTGK